MPVSITRQPTGPIYSVSDAMYVLTSDQINQLEFSFVVDVLISGTRVARLLKQPNPTGTGVFNLSRIFDANLDYDLNSIGNSATTNGAASTKTFQVQFREEYLVEGALSLQPVSAAANDLVIIKGVQEHNTTEVGTSLGSSDFFTSRLSSSHRHRIHRDDYVSASYYDASAGSTVHTPFTIPSSGATYSQIVNGTTFNFDIYDDKSYLGEERFCWFNEQGGIDYFTSTLERQQNVNVNRNTFKGSHLRWGRSNTSNKEAQNANMFISSTKNLQNNFESTFMATLNPITDADRDLVNGLFASRRAFVQKGTEFIPIDVLNGSYRNNLPTVAPESNQPQVMYRLSNDKRTF